MAKADLKKKVVLDIPTTEEEKKKALQSAIAHITKVYGGVTATVPCEAAAEPAAMSQSVKIVPPCAMPSGLSSSSVSSTSTVAPPSLSSVITCIFISLFRPFAF